MEKPRETLLSKFGMFVAYHGATGGMGTLLIPAFMAVRWGGAAFYLWFIVGTSFVVITIFLIDSCFGAYTRRAPPIAWHIITNGNKFLTFWIWFSVMALFIYMPTAAALYGIWGAYLVATPFKFWGPDPDTFFWKTYLPSFYPLICAMILCFIWWLLSYKSVNVWARVAMWSKLAGILLALIFIIVAAMYNPQFWQGWAYTFDLRPEKVFSLMVFAQAMLWVYWRSGAGSAVPTVFASYLPKGGDLNTSCIMERLSDIIFMIMAALFIVPLTMGAGYPPLFGGSLGLAFSALPRVWESLGIAGIILGMLFYALFIPAAFPMTLAYFELAVATFADKFGMPRTKSVTLTTIAIAALSVIFTLPIYDPVNWGSYGFTMIFTAWYWQILICGLACIAEYIVLFRYFKVDKFISFVNENSVIKLPPKLLKVMCYVGFALVLISMSYLFIATSGLVPGVPAGAAGTILADGTGYYGLTPIGYAMIFVGLGLPLILALVFNTIG